MRSVLQDWVMELPLREQGTLLTGMRGCDLAPKHPGSIDERHGCSTGEETAERQLVAFLRYCVMNPADAREVDICGAFFRSSPPEQWKPSQFGHYPLHWYSHVMHCFEVVGYRRPHGRWPAGITPEEAVRYDGYERCPGTRFMGDSVCVRCHAAVIYGRMVSSLHLTVETEAEMIERLSEDRIAKDNVVS